VVVAFGGGGCSTDSLHAQDSAGVVPRFLDVVLEHARDNCIEWSMAVSFVELHNEELRDLLNDQTAEGRARPITLRDSARGGVIVQVCLRPSRFTPAPCRPSAVQTRAEPSWAAAEVHMENSAKAGLKLVPSYTR
jgi:hypothetical protein